MNPLENTGYLIPPTDDITNEIKVKKLPEGESIKYSFSVCSIRLRKRARFIPKVKNLPIDTGMLVGVNPYR